MSTFTCNNCRGIFSGERYGFFPLCNVCMQTKAITEANEASQALARQAYERQEYLMDKQTHIAARDTVDRLWGNMTPEQQDSFIANNSSGFGNPESVRHLLNGTSPAPQLQTIPDKRVRAVFGAKMIMCGLVGCIIGWLIPSWAASSGFFLGGIVGFFVEWISLCQDD
jgi:hypothetical protein